MGMSEILCIVRIYSPTENGGNTNFTPKLVYDSLQGSRSFEYNRFNGQTNRSLSVDKLNFWEPRWMSSNMHFCERDLMLTICLA